MMFEGCGACGRRGARWATRSVVHGKPAGARSASSTNPQPWYRFGNARAACLALGPTSPSCSRWRTSRAAHRKPEPLFEHTSHVQGGAKMSSPNLTCPAITVGIDVAKDTLEVALGPKASARGLTNDTDGIDALLAQLGSRVRWRWSSWRPPAAWNRPWPAHCKRLAMRWRSSTPGRHVTSRERWDHWPRPTAQSYQTGRASWRSWVR